MTQIILTGATGLILLVAFSLFFVWLDERSKKRASQRINKRFQHFDKYYNEMDRETEKQERKRKERAEILGYHKEETIKDSQGVDAAQFSGGAAI